MTINISEAKAHLGRYLSKVRAGETVTICERNKPLAELRAVEPAMQARKLKIGVRKGEFQVPDDFDAPLRDFEGAFYSTGTSRKTRK